MIYAVPIMVLFLYGGRVLQKAKVRVEDLEQQVAVHKIKSEVLLKFRESRLEEVDRLKRELVDALAEGHRLRRLLAEHDAISRKYTDAKKLTQTKENAP
mgnify:CR=1 FL=1